MNHFRTEVEVPRANSIINHNDRLLFMGSCFASNIGQFFSNNCFNTLVNPFGVLYNPFSIANSLERLLRNEVFTKDDIKLHNGSYHSFYHHSQFNHVDADIFLSGINDSFAKAVSFLRQADVIILTFGTAWVYEYKELDVIVSNCHKYPSKEFNRYRLSVEEIVERYRALLDTLREFNPDVRVVFTVSPVRHWKDGAHGNQLSKATLLLAIEELVAQTEGISYFPAYELLLDDLRDYRFFADDMLHPSVMAVEYIRNKFIASHFSDESKGVLKQIEKLKQAASHRPFYPELAAHQQFVDKHIEKVRKMQSDFPGMNLSALLNIFLEQKI